MQESLQLAILICISIMIVSLIIAVALWLHERSAHYRLLIVMWFFLIATFVSQGAIQDHRGLVISFSLQFITFYAIARILGLSTNTPVALKPYIAFWIGGLVLFAVASALELPFQFMALPVALAMVVPVLHVVYKISRAKQRTLTFSNRAMIIVGLLSVVHFLDYPFLRLEAWFAPYGFTISAIQAFALSIFSTTTILEHQLLLKNAQISKHAENLDQQVALRTKELEQSLRDVESLKSQQDADYYLISLLVEPLASAKDLSKKSVDIHSLVQQKKEFTFRQNTGTIGGDLCHVEEIKVNDRQFTIVLNGDAMGKSLQGAGGAIVLAVAIRSLLSKFRSKNTKINQPAQLIVHMYRELDRLFQSFSGAMMTSIVLGLLDTESGQFIFLNADHPLVVLLRKGQASFVGNHLLPKLGSPKTSLDEKIRISSLSLQTGDRVFIGSDGKDEIRMDLGKVNQDEKFFLNIVQETAGDINRMIPALQNHGEIGDDLSLMVIDWKGSAQNGSKVV